jgi:hypothetical protein
MAKIKVEQPYNPLDKKNLGVSVADKLLEQPVSPLPPTEPFTAAGVYAIYYFGPFPAYKALASVNRDNQLRVPIYVGKAVPEGARKGGFGLDASPRRVLYRRLVQHADSIKQASSTLQLEDFACRYLAVDDIWIPLGENMLIERLAPVWNGVLDGFGNHDPGKGRYTGQRSAWDVVHPGREWAEKCAPHSRTAEDLLEAVKAFLREKLTQK